MTISVSISLPCPPSLRGQTAEKNPSVVIIHMLFTFRVRRNAHPEAHG